MPRKALVKDDYIDPNKKLFVRVDVFFWSKLMAADRCVSIMSFLQDQVPGMWIVREEGKYNKLVIRLGDYLFLREKRYGRGIPKAYIENKLKIKLSGPRMIGALKKNMHAEAVSWLRKQIAMSRLIKYPRTFHLPWSDSNSSDDVWWTDGDVEKNLGGRQVVITEKLDGECTTMYNDHTHARSTDSLSHPSRAWVRRLHGQIRHDIPEGHRICGENCYAYHSIFYHMPTYFFVFGIYNENNICLSWDETVQWCELLGLQTVPVIYRGVWDTAKCRSLWTGQSAFPTFVCEDEYPEWPHNFEPTTGEGYVARLEDAFPYEEFKRCAAKYVRSNHVQTSSNWMTKPTVPNLLVRSQGV